MFAWQVDTGHRATINLGYDLNGKIGEWSFCSLIINVS